MIFVGTSGWIYKSWREHLYSGIPVARWLSRAAEVFDAVEVNGSFYTQISRDTYARWRDQTPDDFRFAVKGHRFVTHYKRLRDCERSIVLLRDQAGALEEKLAAVVWQLPSQLEADPPRLAAFCDALAAWPTRHAIELRHRSWFTDEVAAILSRSGVANAMGDAPDFPMWRAVTSDLVYARLHGHTRKYASSYSGPALARWAKDARRWDASGHDVYVFFDNDAEGAAVRNAVQLRERTRRAAARSRRRAA